MSAPVLAGEKFEAPGLGLFHWEPIFSIGPVGVTKPMIMAIIVTIIVCAFFWAAFAKPKLVPRGIQNIGELGWLFVRDEIARPMIGKDGDRWMGLLVSLFFFVWICNLMSVVPFFQFPVTSHIAYPTVLAILIWVIMMVLGIKHQGGWGFFKNVMFMPGLPKGLYFLTAPIEFFSTFLVRPFTHAIRLFANMFAGHLLVALFAVVGYHFLIENIGPFTFPVGVLGVVLTIIMTVFEMFIQALQAYVFAILAAFYIGTALKPEH